MVAQLPASQFPQWLASQPQAMVLDVREPWEVQLASVRAQGFELRTIPMNELPQRLAELSPDTPLACLCHHGVRSQQVALFLQRHGFTDVVNLQGGIDAWSCELDPTVPRYCPLFPNDLLDAHASSKTRAFENFFRRCHARLRLVDGGTGAVAGGAVRLGPQL